MKSVFTDTSAVVALFDRTDAHHVRAGELLETIKKNRIRLVLSDYVFDESVTTAMSHGGHDIAMKVGKFIMESSIIEFIWLSTSLKMRAWEYFKRHADKSYSFTDCTSFMLMGEKKISNYFAFDSHFSQAGFVDFASIIV